MHLASAFFPKFFKLNLKYLFVFLSFLEKITNDHVGTNGAGPRNDIISNRAKIDINNNDKNWTFFTLY